MYALLSQNKNYNIERKKEAKIRYGRDKIIMKIELLNKLSI